VINLSIFLSNTPSSLRAMPLSAVPSSGSRACVLNIKLLSLLERGSQCDMPFLGRMMRYQEIFSHCLRTRSIETLPSLLSRQKRIIPTSPFYAQINACSTLKRSHIHLAVAHSNQRHTLSLIAPVPSKSNTDHCSRAKKSCWRALECVYLWEKYKKKFGSSICLHVSSLVQGPC
jgi:hypothetical protein